MYNFSTCSIRDLPTWALNLLSKKPNNTCECCCIEQNSNQNRIYLAAIATIAIFAGLFFYYVRRVRASDDWIPVPNLHSATKASGIASDASKEVALISATTAREFLVGLQAKLNDLSQLTNPTLIPFAKILSDKLKLLSSLAQSAAAATEPNLETPEIMQGLTELDAQVTLLLNWDLCVKKAKVVTFDTPNLIPLIQNFCSKLDNFNTLLTKSFKEPVMETPVNSLLLEIASIKDGLRQIPNPRDSMRRRRAAEEGTG